MENVTKREREGERSKRQRVKNHKHQNERIK